MYDGASVNGIKKYQFFSPPYFQKQQNFFSAVFGKTVEKKNIIFFLSFTLAPSYKWHGT